MTTHFTFRVLTDLHLSADNVEGTFTSKPKHEGVSIALEMSGSLDRHAYYDKDGQTNATGRKTTQKVLTQGLMAILKTRSEKDNIDLEQLMYETMAELKKWSERDAEIGSGEMKDL